MWLCRKIGQAASCLVYWKPMPPGNQTLHWSITQLGSMISFLRIPMDRGFAAIAMFDYSPSGEAIGVLTLGTRGVACLRFGPGTLVPLQGAAAGCWCRVAAAGPLQDVGCYCEKGVHFGARMLVPLKTAAAGCHCRLPLQGAAASRCCLGAAVRVVCALWSSMLVPLQGAAEGAGAGCCCCCCCQIGVCALELVCWGRCRVPLLEGAAVRSACALWSRHAAGCRCRQGCALWSGHAGAAAGCCRVLVSEWCLQALEVACWCLCRAVTSRVWLVPLQGAATGIGVRVRCTLWNVTWVLVWPQMSMAVSALGPDVDYVYAGVGERLVATKEYLLLSGVCAIPLNPNIFPINHHNSQ